LKEREAEEAQQRAQTEREAIKQEETQIAQEREQPMDSQKEQELADREKELQQRSEEAQKLEDLADQKTDEAQQEREDIAQDQQSTIAAADTIPATDSGTTPPVAAPAGTQQDASTPTIAGLLGITIESTDPARGKLILFNPTTDVEITRSMLNTIHTRSVTFIGNRIFAIAGENRDGASIRLTEIKPDTLEAIKYGDNDIMSGSLIWVNTNFLYAITVDLSNNNACYIGRFDTNLALQAKSSQTVHPQASIAFQQGQLLTQSDDGSALILDPNDLTKKP